MIPADITEKGGPSVVEGGKTVIIKDRIPLLPGRKILFLSVASQGDMAACSFDLQREK